jgi:hypothetical protein
MKRQWYGSLGKEVEQAGEMGGRAAYHLYIVILEHSRMSNIPLHGFLGFGTLAIIQ